MTSRNDILKDFKSLKDLKSVEKNFISRRGNKANGTVSEPADFSDLPKIYGQRILAQGQGKTNIWTWAREKLDGNPNVWVALGNDFYHKRITENTGLRCGHKTCFEESLRLKKICKPAITLNKTQDSTSHDRFYANSCLIAQGTLGIMLILIDLGPHMLKELKFKFRKQLKIALLVPIIIYVAALSVLYQDRFDKKTFCVLNPFERICSSFITEVKSYDGVSTLMKSAETDACRVIATNEGLTTQVQIRPTTGATCVTKIKIEEFIQVFIEQFDIAVANMNNFVLHNGKTLDHYTEIIFFKWNFYKFRVSYNFILPGIMSLIGSREPIQAGNNVFSFHSSDATLKIRLIEQMKAESR